MGYAAAIAAVASLAGTTVAAANAPSAGGIKSRSTRKSLFQPLIFSFLQAGGNLDDLAVTRGGKKGQNRNKLFGPDGQPVRRADTVKVGGQRFLISGKARDIIGAQLNKAQGEAAAQTQKNFDTLFGPEGPQFLKDKITNRPQQIREAFGPAVSQGLRAALGGAAPAGTLTTDAVLQRVAAPLAFQAETLFQGAEDQRNAQQLGLSGVPGFGTGFGANPNNTIQPQGLDFLQQFGLQAAGLSGQFQQYNSQLRNQQQGFRSGLASSAGGGIAGIFGNYAQQKNDLAIAREG